MAKAKGAAAATDRVRLEIPALNLRDIEVRVRGITPLLQNAMDGPTMQWLTDKREGRPVPPQPPPRTDQEKYEAALHMMDGDGTCGVPTEGFRRALAAAALTVGGVTSSDVKRAVRFVAGDLLPIVSEAGPRMHKAGARDAGRNRSPMMAVRAEFVDWEVVLPIRYNADMLSAEQVVNLINHAGFSIGVGAWRPDPSNGVHGMFTVVMDEA